MTEARRIESEETVLELTLRVPPSMRQRGFRRLCKRAFDVVGASALMVAMSPVALAVAIAVKLDSDGPALFRCTRIGHEAVPFTMLKFRSMRVDAGNDLHKAYIVRLMLDPEDEQTRGQPTTFKLDDDPRITRVGGWIRRLSLDELPQLVNVIRGEMSLVGPRPEVPYAIDMYTEEQFRRFEVLPGMTGLWQVEGRGNLPPNEMIRLDAEYAERWTLGLDMAILIRTPTVVMKKIGAR